MTYARYRGIIEQSVKYPAFWRIIAGLVTVVVVAILWLAASVRLAGLVTGFSAAALPDIGTSPGGTAFFLFSIVGLGIGTWCAARLWQGRSLGSLTGRPARLLRDFVTAALVTWAFAGALSLVLLPFSPPLTPNLPLGDWLGWLPLALILVLLQTGSEELVFRGYLQSQLAARFRSPALWLVPPAVLFGALHYWPGAGPVAGLVYVAAASLFGLVAGDLTARTGTIGAAWGFHFANNCVAILLVVQLGAASGLGLYSAGTLEDALRLSPILLADLAAVAAVYLLLRRVLAV